MSTPGRPCPRRSATPGFSFIGQPGPRRYPDLPAQAPWFRSDDSLRPGPFAGHRCSGTRPGAAQIDREDWRRGLGRPARFPGKQKQSECERDAGAGWGVGVRAPALVTGIDYTAQHCRAGLQPCGATTKTFSCRPNPAAPGATARLRGPCHRGDPAFGPLRSRVRMKSDKDSVLLRFLSGGGIS